MVGAWSPKELGVQSLLGWECWPLCDEMEAVADDEEEEGSDD